MRLRVRETLTSAIQFLYRITFMIDKNLARLRAHRQNIDRYRRLLETSLTVLERDFIERRIAEEEVGLNGLASETFPIVLTMPVPKGALAKPDFHTPDTQ